MNLSVAVATYNEEKNIVACLEAVKGLADEIVVVDGGSTDQTVVLAKQNGARVIVASNPSIFHINKQKAIDECRGKWILQLDADEVVTPQLAKEIKLIIVMTDKEIADRVVNPKLKELFNRHQSIIEKRDGKIGDDTGSFTAFFVARKNYFLGKILTYAGTYPDGVIRLIKNGFAKFPAKSVHEQIQIKGHVDWLYHDLLHYSNPTLSKYFSGADKYTSLLANELKNQKKNWLTGFLQYFLIKPFITFINLYLRHKGLLDGWYGFLFCFFSSLHYPVAFVKYVSLR